MRVVVLNYPHPNPTAPVPNIEKANCLIILNCLKGQRAATLSIAHKYLLNTYCMPGNVLVAKFNKRKEKNHFNPNEN